MQFRRLCAAMTLVFALTYNTSAGDMGFPAAPQPTPSSSTTNAEASVTLSPTDEASTEASSTGLYAEIAWSLLQAVLTVQ